MRRLYTSLIQAHFSDTSQMLFLAGPRQAGKTTAAKEWLGDGKASHFYLNWDNQNDRQLLLQGPTIVAETLNIFIAQAEKYAIVFDELHKYRHWKTFLKGFFDTYQQYCQIIVTGSAKLDVYQRGGDSLMGRYFLYRVHPLSVGECCYPVARDSLILPPKRISSEQFMALREYGGFPEPFLQRKTRFSNRWHHLRHQQLFREDIRDLTRVQEIAQLELLSIFLRKQASQLLNYSTLANHIRVSSDTIRRWLVLLEEVYFCFRLSPWSQNITRSLIKEPKVYLWDWSLVEEIGARAENFIACHLLKATQLWTDMGFGIFNLYFIRTKEKQEVDFLVVRDNKPWFLVEVKNSDISLSKSLSYFHQQLNTQHAFQVVLDLEYAEVDCFTYHDPVVVSAKTFLSQLL